MHRVPGEFFGKASKSYTAHGISITHRVADRDPDAVPPHTHSDAHFIWVTSGRYVSIAEGKSTDTSRLLIFNPPGTTHRDHFEHGRGSFFAISVEPGKAAALSAHSELPEHPIYLTEPAQHSMALSIALCNPTDTPALQIDALVHEVLGTMDRTPHPVGPSPPKWLHQAVDLLRDRCREDLSIAHIASSVGVHPIHLARTFRRHFRCTPAAFARFRRLEMAAHLLTRSRLSLAEIAQDCGFGDQSHLTRVFTRGLGLPPGEYRRVAGCRASGSQMFQINKNVAPEFGRIGTEAARPRRKGQR